MNIGIRLPFFVAFIAPFLIHAPVFAETKYNGNLEGNFSVSSKGSANYTIPIDSPPGINGIQPKISLAYNSRIGNGQLGLGWKINGISKITRCLKTLAQDGEIGTVDFNASDSFCLDGQRLVQKQKSSFCGAGNIEYRTEVDLNRRVCAINDAAGDPQYFEIHQPNGNVSQYGNDTDFPLQLSQHKVYRQYHQPQTSIVVGGVSITNLFAPVISVTKNGSIVEDTLGWGINQTSDTSGNVVRYFYRRDGQVGKFQIDHIEYKYINNQPQLSVDFEYSKDPTSYLQTDRIDLIRKYFSGGELLIDDLLTSVRVNLQSTTVSHIDLEYELATRRLTIPSRILTVTRCFYQTCENPIELEWNNDPKGRGSPLGRFTNPTSAASATGGFPYLADMNGDGRDDYVELKNTTSKIYEFRLGFALENGTFEQWTYNTTTFGNRFNLNYFADINGDGIRDFAEVTRYNASVYYLLNGVISKLTVPKQSNVSRAYFADVNGDGRHDYVQAKYIPPQAFIGGNPPSTASVVSLANQSGTLDTPVQTGDLGIDPNNNNFNIYFADVNGDGRDDWIVKFVQEGGSAYSGPNYAKVGLSLGNGLFDFWTTTLSSSNFIQGDTAGEANYFADTNGDGNADWIQVRSNYKGDTHNIKVALSLGDGNFDFWTSETSIFTYSSQSSFFFKDVNGDGRADLIVGEPGYSYSGGVFTDTTNRAHVNLATPDGKYISDAYRGFVHSYGPVGGSSTFGDVNGDGKTDWLISNSTGSSVALAVGDPHYYLTGIYTAARQKYIKIEMLPITDSIVYKKYQESNPPGVQDYQGPIFVVSKVTTEDGIGGVKTLAYSYEGAKRSSMGRGFLGFNKVIVSDENAGKVATTWYRQDFPYTGSVAKSELRLTNGTLIERVGSKYSLDGNIEYSKIKTSSSVKQVTKSIYNISYSVTSYHPYMVSKTIENYDLSGTLIKTVSTKNSSIDLDGCVKESRQIVEDAASSTMHTTITNNAFALPDEYITWLPCKQKRVDVQVDDQVNPLLTRSKSYDYYFGTGLLKTTEIEPDAALNDIDSVYLKTDYNYDNYGNVSSITHSGSNAAKNPIVSRDITISTSYLDPNKVEITQKNSLNEETTTIYNTVWGSVDKTIDSNGYYTEWVYDELGRLIRENHSDGTYTTIDFFLCDSTAVPLCQTSESNYVRSQSLGSAPVYAYYDKYDREVRMRTSGLNNRSIAKDTIYDNQGRIYRQSKNYFIESAVRKYTTITYDELNRPKQILSPDGTYKKYAYSGLTTTTTQQWVGNNVNTELVSVQTNNILGQLVSSVDSNLQETKYTYDTFGNPKTVTDPKLNTISYTFDLRGRNISVEDPDVGFWSFEYDAENNLRMQKDAKNQVINYSYDTLNRVETSVDATRNETSKWDYYRVSDAIVDRNIGQIKAVTRTSDGYSEDFKYNSKGQLYEHDTSVNGYVFKINLSYDFAARLTETRYPQPISNISTRFVKRNVYDSNGYLQQVDDGNVANPKVFWMAMAANPDGNLTWEGYGNGLSTIKGYNPNTGLLESISTGSANQIQNLNYSHDNLGNLEEKIDTNQIGVTTGVTENYYYDNLLRLDYVNRDGSLYRDYSYDELGNLTFKSDKGNYSYAISATNPHGPHAVSRVGNSAEIIYDKNGNLTTGLGRVIDYTTYNKPERIVLSKGRRTNTVVFKYSPSNERYLKRSTSSRRTNTTYYIGKMFEFEQKSNGINEFRHFVYANDKLVAIDTKRSNNANELNYIHADILGSTDVVTAENGQVKARYSYDPFGNPREVAYGGYRWTALSQLTTNRGFTGHEMVSEVGLIHMNGRVYDPEIGRFLTPDTSIPKPTFSQSYNRYSYVLNNPLTYTDPTGFEEEENDDDLSTEPSSQAELDEIDRTIPDHYYEHPDYHASPIAGTAGFEIRGRDPESTATTSSKPTESGNDFETSASGSADHGLSGAHDYDDSQELSWKDAGKFVANLVVDVDSFVNAYNAFTSGDIMTGVGYATLGVLSIAPAGRAASYIFRLTSSFFRGTFSRIRNLIRATPTQVANRIDDVTSPRPKFWVQTKRDNWNQAVDGPSGNTKLCSTCGKELTGNKLSDGKIDYDNDHRGLTWAQRRRILQATRATREDTIYTYQQNLRIQCRTCNRSHEFEGR